MTNNFSYIVGSQIRNLTTNINRKTYKLNVAELNQLVNIYGQDAYLYLLRCLVDQIDLKDQKGQKDQLKIQLLKDELNHLAKQPNFISVICQTFEPLDSSSSASSSVPSSSSPFSEEFISLFSKVLKLPLAQEILLALAVAQAVDPVMQQEGLKYLKVKLPELSQNNIKSLPENVLHNLICFLKTNEALQKTPFLKSLQKLQPSTISLAFSPLVKDNLTLSKRPDNVSTFTNVWHPSQLMEDVGYSCTASGSALKDLLAQFPKLKEQDVALILGVMSRTHTTTDGGVADDTSIPLLTSFGANGTTGTSAPDAPAPSGSWNVTVFVDTIKELFPKLNWPLVIKHLDHPGFLLSDQKGLALIMTIYRKATKEQFPLDVLFDDVWGNTTGQLSFLKLALAAPPDVFNFAAAPRRQPPIDGLHPPGGKTSLSSPWYSLALIETLLRLAEIDHHIAVRAIFDQPVKHCPELLLLGLAQVKPSWNNVLRTELVSALLHVFLSNHSNSSLVLHRLWHINPSLVIRGMIEMYFKDQTSLSRLLDVAQDLKALPQILASRPFSFAMDLAALASHREYLYLEKWLQDRINEHGVQFASSCVTYLKEKLKPRDQSKSGVNFALSPEILASFFKVLHTNAGILTPQLLEELKLLNPKVEVVVTAADQQLAHPHAVQQQSVASTPSVITPTTPSLSTPPSPLKSMLVPPPGVPGQLPSDHAFPADIEEEANSYFKKIYTGQISISDIVMLFKGFKSSKNPREMDIFACMIHNLYDEYRFFPKYPDKELRITGILFGSLIQHQLVSFLSLGLALRQVLEALRKPPDTKMFKFGLCALEQFKPRLCEWPQYCSHILQIPHIRQHHPDIIEYIEKSLSSHANLPTSGTGSTEQPQQPQPVHPTHKPPPVLGLLPSQDASGHHLSVPSVALSFANVNPNANLNATPQPALTSHATSQSQVYDPLPPPVSPPPGVLPLAEGFDQHPLGTALLLKSTREIVQPDEATKDKIHFIFNNVSQQNLEIKANELKELLRTEYNDFLAQYLVVKRVSIEQNFHQLYLTFLEKLNNPKLGQLILLYTHENIRTLLRSEKLKTDISERSVLKHLGSWLGLITLAKNKPLYHKDISLKDLLCQAFDQSSLIAVVPFVAKVLEACAQSKVFKPPNPWVMGIMRLLAEIYQLPDLKLNLKFEIELLCNNLLVDLNEIKPTVTLRDRKLKLLAQDEETKQLGSAIGLPSETSPRSASPINGSASNIAAVEGGQPLPASVDIANLGAYIVYNPAIALLAQNPLLKRTVPGAIERAIREIIAPVVERSVTIAVTTTKELVLKDFATEPDEPKMRRAAHLMVQNLAGNLALVTCKEPLRVSMANHLRASFQINNEHLQQLAEHAISILCTENLDLACTIIEKAATERAIRETDECLASAFTARRKHRERPNGQPFLDMTNLVGRYSATIPDALRPRAGGLQPHQLRIYEDFLVPQPPVAQKLPTSPSSSSFTQVSPAAGVADPSPIPDGAVQDRSSLAVPTINIVANVTHTKMQYVVTQGTVNQPQDGRRTSITGLTTGGDIQGIPIPLQTSGSKITVQDTVPVQDALERFVLMTTEIDKLIARMPPVTLSSIPAEHEIPVIIGKISNLAQTVSRVDDAAVAFAQKAFTKLFEDERRLHKEVYFAILESLREISKKIAPELTNWVIFSEDERKFNLEVIVLLIRAQLLSLPEYDDHIAKLIDSARGPGVLEFAMHLVLRCLVESRCATPADFSNILDTLNKNAQRTNAPESLTKLLDEVRQSGGKDDKMRSMKKLARGANGNVVSVKEGKEDADPAGFLDQVVALFQEWLILCIQPANDKAVASYITQLQQQVFKVDELTQRFLRICAEVSIENCSAPTGDKPDSVSYQTVDAFAKLVYILVKYSDPSSKIKLLNRTLVVVVKAFMRDYESKRTKFNQRPYFRLFDNLLIDFNAPDPGPNAEANPLAYQILYEFSAAFSALQPSKFPGFAFAWLELISHRMFMPKLLLLKGQKGWPLFQRLLVELFRFLEPFLRNAELNDPIRLLYKGTLRVLLVLLHDFPEFLCDFHFCFCDVIPPSCIQMRNLILSAFPRSMRLPDPFTPNLKVDLLPEINQPPRILSNHTGSLSTNNFRVEIDSYLKTRAPMSFLVEMRHRYLMLPQQSADSYSYGTKYNVPVINSLVLYVGTQAIAQLQNKSSQVTPPIAHSAPMDIFQHLALDFDTEGRYLFLNAIANQLRYPNNHTHYFSCVLLYLFAEANQEIIQEQITRVLLERLIVNRPHPWGLLITFIELIKNPRYNFWSHAFTRCAPEIERLFESVARSCMGREPVAKTDLTAPQQPPPQSTK